MVSFILFLDYLKNHQSSCKLTESICYEKVTENNCRVMTFIYHRQIVFATGSRWFIKISPYPLKPVYTNKTLEFLNEII